MVVVLCSDELPLHLPERLRRSVEITTDWSGAERLLPGAAGLVVVQRRLADVEVLSRLRGLREQFPLLRLAIAFEMDAANVDAFTHACAMPARVLDIQSVELELPALVRNFEADPVSDLLSRALIEYATSPESRLAVAVIFTGPTVPRTEADIARAVGCPRQRIRTRVTKDLGLTPHRLLRWSRLIRALELQRSETRLVEVCILLDIADTTPGRDARALLGATLARAKAGGARVAAMRLLDAVRRHHPGTG